MMHSFPLLETLADPTRRRVVEALRGGERAVGEIVAQVSIDQSGVSRHLRILHEAGVVTMRPVGSRRLYSLEAKPFRELEEWISSYRAIWDDRLHRLQRQLDQRWHERPTSQERKG